MRKKKTSVRELIEAVEDKTLRNKLKKYVPYVMMNKKEENILKVIRGYFIWSKTDEGVIYWNTIAFQLSKTLTTQSQ